MVAIARALLGSPGLVLFDEPSQGLAPKVVLDVQATIKRLKAEGISAIVVEQNADVALAVADRVIILDSGRIAWTGPRRHPCAKTRNSSRSSSGNDRGRTDPRRRQGE